jgi:hypothetical protein
MWPVIYLFTVLGALVFIAIVAGTFIACRASKEAQAKSPPAVALAYQGFSTSIRALGGHEPRYLLATPAVHAASANRAKQWHELDSRLPPRDHRRVVRCEFVLGAVTLG